MQIFINTANPQEIQELLPTGAISGVTTNPSLISKSNVPALELIKGICMFFNGPVNVQVGSRELSVMIKQARILAKISGNVVVKIPMTQDGLTACKGLSSEGIKVNLTLCFSSSQAILAAASGASYVSVFSGRLDEMGFDSKSLLIDICKIYRTRSIATKIIAASISNKKQVVDAALSGVDISTISPEVFREMSLHHFTEKGLSEFLQDWKISGQSIE